MTSAIDPTPAPAAPALKQGAVGWVLLASLGISYVIAGDYAAWNFGIKEGGCGGLLLAVAFGAVMYFALLSTFGELATLIPESGGGSAFATRAFGDTIGCLAGACILVEYLSAAAVVSIFLQAYLEALTGIGGPAVIVAAFALFIAIHSWGVREALRVLLAIAIVGIAGLTVFVCATAGHFDYRHLIEMPVHQALGASRWLPRGLLGIWAALPFGTAFFLGVEGIALAAEETRDPHRNLPRGMFAALFVLTSFAVLLVIFGPGASGAATLSSAEAPLIVVLEAVGAGRGPGWILTLVDVCGFAALMACLFSAIFGYSRLTFALARSGYLPAFLARTNRRLVPLAAIVVPGVVACLLALTGASEQIFVLMVCAATLSYLLIVPAHWAMRRRFPQLPRPFRTPGGIYTAALAWLASALMFAACFIADPAWSGVAMGLVLILLASYKVRQRRRLPVRSPS